MSNIGAEQISERGGRGQPLDAVADALLELSRNVPLLDGVALSVTFTGAGSSTVNHGLGRTPAGWIVTSINAAQTVFEAAKDDKRLTLTASGAVTVALWVF
jgi:ABC-type amino acid transport system permease subunit